MYLVEEFINRVLSKRFRTRYGQELPMPFRNIRKRNEAIDLFIHETSEFLLYMYQLKL